MQKAVKKKEQEEWTVEKPKLDNARKLRGTNFIDPEDGESQETIKKRKKDIGNLYGSGYALQDGDKNACLELTETAANENTNPRNKRSIPVLWKLTNPQRNVWNLPFQEIMKITSLRTDSNLSTIAIWCTNSFLCLK